MGEATKELDGWTPRSKHWFYLGIINRLISIAIDFLSLMFVLYTLLDTTVTEVCHVLDTTHKPEPYRLADYAARRRVGMSRRTTPHIYLGSSGLTTILVVDDVILVSFPAGEIYKMHKYDLLVGILGSVAYG